VQGLISLLADSHEWIMGEGKKQIKEEIIRKLIENRVFWSYRKPGKQPVSDELVRKGSVKHMAGGRFTDRKRAIFFITLCRPGV
jgi:hypothetical protein